MTENKNPIYKYVERTLVSTFLDRSMFFADVADQLVDKELQKELNAFFRKKRWIDVHKDELFARFGEDSAMAFYSMNENAKVFFLPSAIRITLSEYPEYEKTRYLLKNLLSPIADAVVNVQSRDTRIEEAHAILAKLDRRQRALSIAAMTYVDVMVSDGRWA
jgi:hypothetical protein